MSALVAMADPVQPSLRRLRHFEVRPDRDLGQNFLIDSNILEVIARAAALDPADVVLEIGGGLGVLSEHLAPRVAHVHVIEIDRRLEPALLDAVAPLPNITLHWGDAMRLDLAGLRPAPTKVAANLPYGIAAGVLLRTIEELPEVRLWIAMAQREVAQRLAAEPGGGLYGVSSVIAQARMRGEDAARDPEDGLSSRAQRRLGPGRDGAPAGGGISRACGAGAGCVRAQAQGARALGLDRDVGRCCSAPPRARPGGTGRDRAAAGRQGRAGLARAVPRAGKAAEGVSGVAGFESLRALAPAKINLGLFVGPPRQRDGRHELVSVMQSISLADELTLAPAPESDHDELACPGVQTPPEHNLAMRALAAFRSASGWETGPVRLQVAKRVPVAAGLGGGSGDAAAALRLAAAASGLGDQDMLLGIAATLGADVPAQVSPGRWLAQGAGERLHSLSSPSVPFGVLVLTDAELLSTAAVYGELDRRGVLRSGEELERLAAELEDALTDGKPLPPADLIANDLQAPALALCPSIAASLARARDAGADLAILSGSGPTVLGLFGGRDGPAAAQRAAQALQARGVPAHAAAPVEDRFGAVWTLDGARAEG